MDTVGVIRPIKKSRREIVRNTRDSGYDEYATRLKAN